MVFVMKHCNNCCDAWRNSLVLARLQELHGVWYVNEEGKVDL
jgi:hypothetical protein